MKKYSVALLAVIVGSATVLSQDRDAQRKFIIERAQSLELDTPYVPPPGDALEHHTAGFAKIMCSAVFITGLDLDFALENSWCKIRRLHHPDFWQHQCRCVTLDRDRIGSKRGRITVWRGRPLRPTAVAGVDQGTLGLRPWLRLLRAYR